MKLVTLMLAGAVLACTSTAWAQNQSAASAPVPANEVVSNDAIARMRENEATEDHVDRRKAEAKKERDVAIAAARSGATVEPIVRKIDRAPPLAVNRSKAVSRMLSKFSACNVATRCVLTSGANGTFQGTGARQDEGRRRS
ncbi:hypothetical protein OKW33_005785 [Paraburkholderia atlantica]|uniref:hypothetical protein n=1 Tax=Paraburkholderia atlantica TaxID=2654982 RepID=UPI001590888D|nr:hypothetical protein [Paraburkholderia atlantica]